MSSLLSAFDFLELDCGGHLLGVKINAQDFTETSEEVCDCHHVKFIIWHILEVDGKATRIYYIRLLMICFTAHLIRAATWSSRLAATHETTLPLATRVAVHGHI